MDEYVDCPYCHAASPAAEFTAGFGHCPFCGAANYELDGYMGHLGHRTAASNDDVTRAVRDATGINLSMTNAGGGTYVFDGRLDDGSWIVANDSDGRHYGDMLERTEDEKPEWDDEPGTPLGWNVGIYPNLDEDGEDTWMGNDSYPIHNHDDPDATVDDLPRVIQHALTTMPRRHDDDHHTDKTGSTMNRTAAIDFVAAQNTRDRDELLFRAHRHASQLTCRLTVPEAQRAVRAFVAAVNREALRTAAAPEDEACGDCGADAGEECRFYCTGKAAHDDEVAEGKRKEGSRRTASVVADFADELMF
jgi:hypothetical protein